MKALFIQLLIFLSNCSFAQPYTKGEGLELVLKSKDFGYAQLRSTLDKTQLPDSFFRSLLTIKGTTNNYIDSHPFGSQGYIATLGLNLSQKQAKALA